MKLFYNTCFLLILLTYTLRASAQEIKIAEFKSDPRDISARENTVYDANGDPCSLIKARCGISDLNYESDLGIQKIEKREGEFWIWVPAGTKKIVVSLKDSLSYNFDLPQLTEEYKVYIIVFSVILPIAIEYKDIPKLSLNSNPPGAKIYLNEVFYGNTPINVNYNSDSIKIRVEKKTYETIFREVSSTTPNKDFSFKLKKDPSVTRFFISLTIDPINYEILNPGVSFGMLGKTGFFLSLRPGLIEPDFKVSRAVEITDTSAFFLNYFTESKLIFKKFELFGGVTKRVYKNLFISAGFGYLEYTKYQKLTYNILNQQKEETKYQLAEINDFDGVYNLALDLQLYYRLWNKLLINFQSTFTQREGYTINSFSNYNPFNNSTSLTQFYDYTGDLSWHADIKIGIGYLF